jgi:hypothetical protein
MRPRSLRLVLVPLVRLVPLLVVAFSATGCGGGSPPGGTSSAVVGSDSGVPATSAEEADASPSLSEGVDSAPAPLPTATPPVDSGASADAGVHAQEAGVTAADGGSEAATLVATSGDASEGAMEDACSCPDAGMENSATQGQSAQGFGTQGSGGQGSGTQGGPVGPPGCPCGDYGGFQGQQGSQGGFQGGGFQGAGGDGGGGFSRRHHRAPRPAAGVAVHCVPLFPGSPWLSCH